MSHRPAPPHATNPPPALRHRFDLLLACTVYSDRSPRLAPTPHRTDAHTVTRVTSEVGFWPVRNRIEAFGLARVPKAGQKVS